MVCEVQDKQIKSIHHKPETGKYYKATACSIAQLTLRSQTTTILNSAESYLISSSTGALIGHCGVTRRSRGPIRPYTGIT